MPEELIEALVWIIRVVLFAGIAWGGWLCIAASLPPRTRSMPLEHFATFALLVLLLTTLGSLLRGG